jgi:hypothetical protein
LYRTEIKSYEELSQIIKTRGRLVYWINKKATRRWPFWK